ncbi:MAG: class I SAM-dependent methyltransferase [Desulfomonile tiedjei]|nr:class I SAM-dependent methyltransferase [Desulfomonile tiedjei]
MFKLVLTHPLARNLDLDDPKATVVRRQILREKVFLRKLYQEWYRWIVEALPRQSGPVLELGAGAGFLQDHIPDLITSDLLHLPDISLVLDAHCIPFRDGTLRAVVMIDVLHHLPRPRIFFAEALRCLKPGGAVIMIEPWVTPWSTLIYSRLHHEPFQPRAKEWEFPSSGPLSGANGALPWIIFKRDLDQFQREFPEWRLKSIDAGMPFSYLLSGGMALRSLVPGSLFGPARRLEKALGPWMNHLAMFGRVVLEKTELL